MTLISFLNQLSPRSRELVQNCLVTAFVFDYVRVEERMSTGSSKFGGSADIAASLVPKDKNGDRMNLLVQINFAELQSIAERHVTYSLVDECKQDGAISDQGSEKRGGGLSILPPFPTNGVLMVFVSPKYRSFKEKDCTWYKLIYLSESELSQQPLGGGWREFALSAKAVELLPLQSRAALLSTLKDEDVARLSEWIGEEEKHWSKRLCEGQLLFFPFDYPDGERRRAEIMAAFHANGITFDEQRALDLHYKHLVDGSIDWISFFRIAGLEGLISEKRDLYVCIRREDLIKQEFLKGALVFL